jgi:hypothetical protein
VQMLYFPGLQNVVADFLSCPSLLPQLIGDVAAGLGGTAGQFRRDSCRAKPQHRNAALAWRNISYHPYSTGNTYKPDFLKVV